MQPPSQRGHGKIDPKSQTTCAVPVPSPLSFRPARADEAELLTELCRASKAHWGYPAEWLAAWRDALTISPAEAAGGWVHVAECEGAVVGFFGLARPARRWHLEHLWIAPAWIGRGWGRVLFQAAVAEAARRGARTVHIKSDPHAEGFYLKMGAARTGEEVYQLSGARRTLPRLRYDIGGRAEWTYGASFVSDTV